MCEKINENEIKQQIECGFVKKAFNENEILFKELGMFKDVELKAFLVFESISIIRMTLEAYEIEYKDIIRLAKFQYIVLI